MARATNRRPLTGKKRGNAPVDPWASGWDKRRLRMDLILSFFAGIIIVTIYNEIVFGDENGTLQVLSLAAIAALASTVTAYLGIATLDDNNTKKASLEALAIEREMLAPPVVEEVTTSTTVTKKEEQTTTSAPLTPDVPVEEPNTERPPEGWANN